MNPEARTWRRLALAATGTIGLLIARVLSGRPLLRPSQSWLGETRDQELERRLKACEANLQSIWEHLNGNAGNG